MIWRIATRFAELSGAALRVTEPIAYALMDGVFQHALLASLSGDQSAPDTLEATVRELMPVLLVPGG